jgi:hypothetical protein
MPKIISAQIVDVGRFKAFYFGSIPPRLEAAVIFDGETVNQKLIFQLMDISWRHGFGCSAPHFEEDGNMVFSVGTTLPSSKSLQRYSVKLNKCLEELADFSVEFARQLDFSTLDISMFVNLDIEELDLSLIAIVRDQKYNGNWDAFYRAMKESGRDEEAQAVECCQEFEKINGKDIGLIGGKLIDTLATVLEGEGAHQN